MSLCRVVACVWDRRSAREGISAQVLRGHPSTDLGTFRTTVEYPLEAFQLRSAWRCCRRCSGSLSKNSLAHGITGKPCPR